MSETDALVALSVLGGNDMKRIPIAAAKRIADEYGYDQVVVYARKVNEGEHMTTYGVSTLHCSIAARIGATLKKFMGWNA